MSIAVTNARAAGGQFVLGVRALPGLPYDGHKLSRQIAHVERLTGPRARLCRQDPMGRWIATDALAE